jgi:hypothetical protein
VNYLDRYFHRFKNFHVEKRVDTLPRIITIYQDEIPVGGGEDFNVEKK